MIRNFYPVVNMGALKQQTIMERGRSIRWDSSPIIPGLLSFLGWHKNQHYIWRRPLFVREDVKSRCMIEVIYIWVELKSTSIRKCRRLLSCNINFACAMYLSQTFGRRTPLYAIYPRLILMFGVCMA